MAETGGQQPVPRPLMHAAANSPATDYILVREMVSLRWLLVNSDLLVQTDRHLSRLNQ